MSTVNPNLPQPLTPLPTVGFFDDECDNFTISPSPSQANFTVSPSQANKNKAMPGKPVIDFDEVNKYVTVTMSVKGKDGAVKEVTHTFVGYVGKEQITNKTTFQTHLKALEVLAQSIDTKTQESFAEKDIKNLTVAQLNTNVVTSMAAKIGDTVIKLFSQIAGEDAVGEKEVTKTDEKTLALSSVPKGIAFNKKIEGIVNRGKSLFGGQEPFKKELRAFAEELKKAEEREKYAYAEEIMKKLEIEAQNLSLLKAEEEESDPEITLALQDIRNAFGSGVSSPIKFHVEDDIPPPPPPLPSGNNLPPIVQLPPIKHTTS